MPPISDRGRELLEALQRAGVPGPTATAHAGTVAAVESATPDLAIAHLAVERGSGEGPPAIAVASGTPVHVELPSLDAGASSEIVAENIAALSSLYFAAMLDEMKLFAVADK